MHRSILPLALLALAPMPLAAQNAAAAIENAMSAAPPAIAKHATIMGTDNKVLRQGTNGWVCMPDNPGAANNAPMCLDRPWLDFVDALMNKREPRITQVGIGYMLQEDMPVSNVDPFATGPTADNQWVANAGPHIMMIFPDARSLDGFPTDPNNGGPWVMWKGTPYAHLMIPTPKQ